MGYVRVRRNSQLAAAFQPNESRITRSAAEPETLAG
jgi:hypothetical protein